MVRNIELSQALELISKYAVPVTETETVPLFMATGMILAEDVIATHDQPPFDRSPLDGFAVRSEDLKDVEGGNPAELEVIDEICAGMVSQETVLAGQAVRIMTGAPTPRGADCVVRQEATERNGDIVRVFETQKHHDNICFAGEDYEKGCVLLKKGERLDAVKLGIVSGNGQNMVTVYRKPKVAVLTSGDEIFTGEGELPPGKIFDSNCQMLSGRVYELGCEPCVTDVLRDDVDEAIKRINQVVDQVDCVITAGALSVGVKDIMHDVIDGLGAEKIFHRVRLKPGSPASLAILRGKPVLSLSGNPFAALATFEILARHLLALLRQDDTLKLQQCRGVMASEFGKKSKSRRFLRADFREGQVYLRGGNSSGILSSMAGCNCLIDIPAGNMGLKPGDQVNVLLL